MEKLLKTGQLTYPDPVPPRDPLPDSYRADQYCNFHRDAGHRTDRCLRLRHAIQDLIDQGVIPAPPPLKPNTQTNAMPRHTTDAKINQISLVPLPSNPSSTLFDPINFIIPATQSKPIVPIHAEPEVSMIALHQSIKSDQYFWEDLIQHFNLLEVQGFPQPVEELPEDLLEEEEEPIHDYAWGNQVWENQWVWDSMDSDPLDEVSLPLLFPGSQTLGNWEKPEELEWDPEPNGWQLNNGQPLPGFQAPLEYDEEGYPAYLNRRVLGGIMPAILKLGDAVTLEEFDPVGFIVSEDSPRPLMPMVDSLNVSTLNSEPAGNWWEKDEPVAAGIGDEVWTVNPSMVVGGLWDIPFQVQPTPLSPAEFRTMSEPVQSIEPVWESKADQSLRFWESLSLEDLGGDASMRQQEQMKQKRPWSGKENVR